MSRPPSRRAVLGAGAAVVAGVGALPAPVQAAAAPSADAAVVAAVDRTLDTWERMVALTSHLVTVPPDVQAEWDALHAVWAEALEEALALPASGIDGFRAKARLAHSFVVTDRQGRLPASADMPARTAWSLINDLMGTEGGAA